MSRKKLGAFLRPFGFFVFLSSVWLHLDYAGRPEQPVPEQGRVWEVTNHGDRGYVTTREYMLLWSLEVFGIASVGAGLWLYQQTKDK